MKLQQVESKLFQIVDDYGNVTGEVTIRPPALGTKNKVVEITTWSPKSRWRNQQRVVVDLSVIGAILSESGEGKD